jgi:hypothetical protein
VAAARVVGLAAGVGVPATGVLPPQAARTAIAARFAVRMVSFLFMITYLDA